jgi:SpoVK/Ycf46/Vps4 family AAA+-type ATPase
LKVPLKLEGFSVPRWKADLMDNLVLKDEHKKLISRLCQLYVHRKATGAVSTSSSNDARPRAHPWTADYIDNKGKGLVLLLHGKPGMGKTYTAECIAHTLKRPLLHISCADIGVAPPDVEKNLRNWFTLARAWDAVLLIDEADVYFESRETQDLERNNLVASFLRVIEYHDGILFLTTNRIGTSDEALWSRIHATIYYEDFGETARRKIWETYFRKLKEDRGKEIVISEEARDFIESPKMEEAKWNGREIRNGTSINPHRR